MERWYGKILWFTYGTESYPPDGGMGGCPVQCRQLHRLEWHVVYHLILADHLWIYAHWENGDRGVSNRLHQCERSRNVFDPGTPKRRDPVENGINRDPDDQCGRGRGRDRGGVRLGCPHLFSNPIRCRVDDHRRLEYLHPRDVSDPDYVRSSQCQMTHTRNRRSRGIPISTSGSARI